MRNLLPEFIQQHYQQGCFTNNFSVCSMFVDIPGFTQTTEALIRSGQAVGHILTAQGIFVEAEAHYQDALTIRR